MRKDIKKYILQNKESALQCADFILNKNEITYEEFDEVFTTYLCRKFILEQKEITTDNFYEICQISAEKASKWPKDMVDAAEQASKCGGATTAMNKKVLFLMAVKREYQIELDPMESAAIDTFSQLKKVVYDKVQAKK